MESFLNNSHYEPYQSRINVVPSPFLSKGSASTPSSSKAGPSAYTSSRYGAGARVAGQIRRPPKVARANTEHAEKVRKGKEKEKETQEVPIVHVSSSEEEDVREVSARRAQDEQDRRRKLGGIGDDARIKGEGTAGQTKVAAQRGKDARGGSRLQDRPTDTGTLRKATRKKTRVVPSDTSESSNPPPSPARNTSKDRRPPSSPDPIAEPLMSPGLGTKYAREAGSMKVFSGLKDKDARDTQKDDVGISATAMAEAEGLLDMEEVDFEYRMKEEMFDDVKRRAEALRAAAEAARAEQEEEDMEVWNEKSSAISAADMDGEPEQEDTGPTEEVYDPDAMATTQLCFFCSSPLPTNASVALVQEMINLANDAKHAPLAHNPNRYILDFRLRADFCAKHRHETEFADVAETEGFPRAGEVDWRALPDRLEMPEVRKVMEKLCRDPARSAIFRRIQGEFGQRGRMHWEAQNLVGGGLERLHAGYYGEIGRIVIDNHFQNLLDWKLLPSLMDTPPSCAPLRPAEFITHVLMPEAAIALIVQDRRQHLERIAREGSHATGMDFDIDIDHDIDGPRPPVVAQQSIKALRTDARRIWNMSREYGQHVFPASGRAVEDVEAWVYDGHVKHIMRGEAIARREREAVEKLQRQGSRAREEKGSAVSRRVPAAAVSRNGGNEMDDSEVELIGSDRMAPKIKDKGTWRDSKSAKAGMVVVDVENDIDIEEINHGSIGPTALTKKAKARTEDEAIVSGRSHSEASDSTADMRKESTYQWRGSSKGAGVVSKCYAGGTTASRSSRSALPPSQESEPDYGDDWMADLGASQMDRLDQLCA